MRKPYSLYLLFCFSPNHRGTYDSLVCSRCRGCRSGRVSCLGGSGSAEYRFAARPKPVKVTCTGLSGGESSQTLSGCTDTVVTGGGGDSRGGCASGVQRIGISAAKGSPRAGQLSRLLTVPSVFWVSDDCVATAVGSGHTAKAIEGAEFLRWPRIPPVTRGGR